MDTAIFISALVLGFGSGFHCIGMCGPIALSMGLTKKQALNFHLQNFTYNVGRIVTYIFLGAILGMVGKGFQLAGFQQYLTIFSGIVLILMAFFSYGSTDVSSRFKFLSRFLFSVKANLSRLLQKTDYSSRFLTGILNGFLPCGMVYIALTASLAAGGVWQGALFMGLFGLGTLPFMYAVVGLGSMVSTAFRANVLKMIPILLLIMGGLFILRGLELGIPYISPKSEALQVNHNSSEQHNSGDHSTCH